MASSRSASARRPGPRARGSAPRARPQAARPRRPPASSEPTVYSRGPSSGPGGGAAPSCATSRTPTDAALGHERRADRARSCRGPPRAAGWRRRRRRPHRGPGAARRRGRPAPGGAVGWSSGTRSPSSSIASPGGPPATCQPAITPVAGSTSPATPRPNPSRSTISARPSSTTSSGSSVAGDDQAQRVDRRQLREPPAEALLEVRGRDPRWPARSGRDAPVARSAPVAQVADPSPPAGGAQGRARSPGRQAPRSPSRP